MSTERKFILPTDAEEAAINRGIAQDPDAVVMPDAQFETAVAAKRKPGRPAGSVASSRKEQVTMRLDAEVLAAMRATGDGWQTRVNDTLRKEYLPRPGKAQKASVQ